MSKREQREDLYEVDGTLYWNPVCATCKHRYGEPLVRCVKCKNYEV